MSKSRLQSLSRSSKPRIFSAARSGPKMLTSRPETNLNRNSIDSGHNNRYLIDTPRPWKDQSSEISVKPRGNGPNIESDYSGLCQISTRFRTSQRCQSTFRFNTNDMAPTGPRIRTADNRNIRPRLSSHLKDGLCHRSEIDNSYPEIDCNHRSHNRSLRAGAKVARNSTNSLWRSGSARLYGDCLNKGFDRSSS